MTIKMTSTTARTRPQLRLASSVMQRRRAAPMGWLARLSRLHDHIYTVTNIDAEFTATTRLSRSR